MNDVPFAIETTDLRKSFGDTLAVDGIDLRIPRGSVYGLLGPNSAGKTTIRMLATLLRPDSGTATVLGHDVVGEATAVRSKVSLTGQYASVDEDLTGRENLVLAALAQTGPIPLGELADVLGLEYTTLTRSANLMEEDGLVASALVVAVFAPLSLRKYRAER